MTDVDEFLKRVNEQREWEATKRRFYGEFLPTIIGMTIKMSRSYGHARYTVLSAHERDIGTTYVLFHYDAEGKAVLTGNQIFPRTLRVNMRRIGGYEGPGDEFPTLQEVLEKFTATTEDAR